MNNSDEETNNPLFGNFGEEVNRDIHKNFTKFAEILETLNSPGMSPQIDLTIVDSNPDLLETETECTARNTRSKRKINEDSGCMNVGSSVKKEKNKRKVNKKKGPVLLNSNPIEINDSEDEKEKEVTIGTDFVEIPLKEEDFNTEVSVKVIWKSVNSHRFKMRKYQKMKYIFDYFNKLSGIEENKLFFVVNGKMVYPDDTPESLEISIIDIIDGGEVRTSIDYNEPRSPKKLDNDSIEFKILVKNRKRPMFVRIKKTEPMIILMIKVAEQLGVPLKNLKFSFDGEDVKTFHTAAILDMEGGECIEVMSTN